MKEAILVISVILTLIGYSFYWRDVFADRTKPHAFSWLVWGLLTVIAFFGQLSDGAGAGAVVTGLTGVISLLLVPFAFVKGEKDITKSDKFNLLGAFAALGLWAITSDPLMSIILITIVDFLGFLPTFRKSYVKPHEETLIHYVLAGLKFALSLLILDSYTVTTWLYPASLVAANWLFVAMLIARRKQLNDN